MRGATIETEATRRTTLAAATLGMAAMLLLPRPAQPQDAKSCLPGDAQAAFALLDRYVAAVNAGLTSDFPAIVAEDYIQHSGRSPSGLAAFIANVRAQRAIFPDWQLAVQDRIFGDGKLVARNLF